MLGNGAQRTREKNVNEREQDRITEAYYDHMASADGGQSNCCGVGSLGEVVDGMGICAACREHACFEEED